MQSWGERARWSVRDTAPEPTKSGVVGLLGCALGLRSDRKLRELSQALKFGVRCDQPGRPIVDYHTVGGGYGRPMLLDAYGKPKISSGGPHNEQTWRHYLCDASFLVALQGEPALIERLTSAAQSPHWPIYLGRKACIPGRPPFDGTATYEDLVAALRGWKPVDYPVRAVVECSPTDPRATRRRDAIDSRSRRTFRPRYACEMRLFDDQRKEDA